MTAAAFDTPALIEGVATKADTARLAAQIASAVDRVPLPQIAVAGVLFAALKLP